MEIVGKLNCWSNVLVLDVFNRNRVFIYLSIRSDELANLFSEYVFNIIQKIGLHNHIILCMLIIIVSIIVHSSYI